jgi:hypothetical protein
MLYDNTHVAARYFTMMPSPVLATPDFRGYRMDANAVARRIWTTACKNACDLVLPLLPLDLCFPCDREEELPNKPYHYACDARKTSCC